MNNTSTLFQKPNESNTEYISRICEMKDRGEFNPKFTWKDLAQLLNNQLQLNYSESWYRKGYRNGDFQNTITSGYISTEDNTPDTEYNITTSATTDTECDGDCEHCSDLPICLTGWREELSEKESQIDNKTQTLQKERIKLSDVMSQNRAYLRRISREETIKEIAYNYAETMNKSLKLPAPAYYSKSDCTDERKEGILLLSDWHYGMECNNPWNKFNPEICKLRVHKLLNKVIQKIHLENLSKITVLNLSDLIAGRIHTQIRIESRFDVITQTMEVSEILAEFLNQLSLHCEIDFYDCLDNHSRLEPNKNDSMDLESLVRIIPWYLKQRLSHNSYIHIKDNEFGADIITCQVLGHDIIAVHGDHDSPVNGLDKLTLMTHRHYDLFCTAHRHHFYMDEKNHALIVGNSSLMGTDSYAEKLRLSSDPSQTLIIVTEENICEDVCRIILK